MEEGGVVAHAVVVELAQVVDGGEEALVEVGAVAAARLQRQPDELKRIYFRIICDFD